MSAAQASPHPPRRHLINVEKAAVISRVLVINTGGTIGMVDKGRGYEPEPGFMDAFLRKLSMFHDNEFYDTATHGPGLITGVSKYGRRCYFEIIEYDPVLDSSDMNMSDWSKISGDIQKHYADWDAFVVLHGTDTMAYTASALSFMLENLGKSVVITGSQVPMSQQRNDGTSNFQGALIVASHFVIPEVTLFFDNQLMRGNRCSKVHASSLAAFASPNIPPLLKFGINVDVQWDAIIRPKSKPFSVSLKMDPNVAVLRLFPGITASTIAAICRPPVKGVVLQSFGAGNCPENDKVLGAFKAATDQGILILNLTQCHGGYVSDAYRAGKILLEVGVLAGGDMTPEAALAKMSWVLAKDHLTYEQKAELLSKNVRGERSVTGTDKFSLSDVSFVRDVAQAVRVNTTSEMQQLKEALGATLLCCAASTGDTEVLKELCDEGLNVNMTDYDGRTPLHIAASHGSVDMVKYLLGEGALVHAVDRFGFAPLRDALNQGHMDVARLLIEAGASLHADAIELGVLLCALAANGDTGRLGNWLEAGANVNAADYDGRTPLHIACANGVVPVVEMLLARPGVDRDVVDAFGRTPKHEAEINGHAGIVAMLGAK